ncbi:olfactory receptor 1L6-like [Mastomys coucha]|uniref:olfactory receptor 1L6-like n=1 Tax=Mastomys coucha TaxID=35658 RepID=UPI0012619A7F|nr:olfactory receptor 1L6-like [Mastomys coucha]
MSNHSSSSTSDFILLGLSSNPWMQKPLFGIFITMYLVTVMGNVLIILAIHSDSRLHTPMYFFLSNLSFMDICFTTVIVPKMLVNLLSETKTISYVGCLVQMYFFMALGNTDSYLLASMAIDRLVAICNPLLRIIVTVLRIPSAAGKWKAFSTCGSHLTVVTLFYGSIIYVYFRPLSMYSVVKDRVATVMYTIVTPMMNPFIYSLRNKDMKRGLKKLMDRVHS